MDKVWCYFYMESKTIIYTNIKEINVSGIIYVEENRNESFIDFKECRRNWVDFANNSDDMSCTNLKEEETRCVGNRDILGKPSFIELFSEPRVKIIFPYKDDFLEKLFKTNSRKSSGEFLKVQESINENGWTTFDLS